jgi:predicted enzyme related to lactoylglutathione lyase
MAKVLGVGGVFFKSPDPVKLYEWYAEWLGFKAEPDSGYGFQPTNMPRQSFTVWSAFKASTKYFQPSSKEFMFNLVVDDLAGALSQVKQGGAQLVGGVEEFDYGRFGWFIDPDGNKVELWEPPFDEDGI